MIREHRLHPEARCKFEDRTPLILRNASADHPRVDRNRLAGDAETTRLTRADTHNVAIMGQLKCDLNSLRRVAHEDIRDLYRDFPVAR